MSERFASDAIRDAILTLAREIGRLERENAALRRDLAAVERPTKRRARKLLPLDQSRARFIRSEPRHDR